MENVKKVVVKLERRLNTEVRRQEKLNLAKERDFRREKLLVIAQGGGQTLGLGLVDKNRTVVYY